MNLIYLIHNYHAYLGCIQILEELAVIMNTKVEKTVQVESEEELKQKIDSAYSKANPPSEAPNIYIEH